MSAEASEQNIDLVDVARKMRMLEVFSGILLRILHWRSCCLRTLATWISLRVDHGPTSSQISRLLM
jgi:hypothetical protein